MEKDANPLVVKRKKPRRMRVCPNIAPILLLHLQRKEKLQTAGSTWKEST